MIPMIPQAINMLRQAGGLNPIVLDTKAVQFRRSLAGRMGSYLPRKVEDNPDYYETVLAVYTAISVIAQNASSLSTKVLSRNDDGSFTDHTDKPEFVVFKKPNPWHDASTFWERNITSFCTMGENPWLLGNRPNFGKYFWSIPPLRFKVYGGERELYDHFGLVFYGTAQERRLEVEDVLFVKTVNPKDELRGLSPLSAARHDIELEINVVTTSKNIFEKGAIPSGLLSTEEKYGEAAFERFMERIEDQSVGIDKAGSMMYLDGGWKFTPFGLPLKDLEAIAQRKITLEHVATAFKVPPIYMGSFKETSRISNAAVQERLLWHNAIMPILRKYENAITTFLIPQLVRPIDATKYLFRFDVGDVSALREDATIKAKRYTEGVKLAAASPNDYREEVLRLPRVVDPAMDTHYLNGVPITGGGSEPVKSETLIRLGKVKGVVGDLISPQVKLGEVIDAVFDTQECIEESIEETDRKIIIAGLLSLRNRIAYRLRKGLSEIFTKQLEEVVASVLSQKTLQMKAVKAKVDWKKWNRILADLGIGYMEEGAIRASVDFAERDKLIILTTDDENVRKFVGSRSKEYAHTVNGSSKVRIDAIIREGIADGLSVDEIAARLRVKMATGYSFRSHLIARTEVVGATNFGRNETMRINGVTLRQWNTQRDKDVRKEHEDVDGETAEIDEPYSNGLMYPNEPNCRCYETSRRMRK